MENNNPDDVLNEENDISILNQITTVLETNLGSVPQDHDLLLLCHLFLRRAMTDKFIIAIIRCVTAYIKKNVQFCYEMVNKGVYNQIVCLINPSENNPKISLDVAIVARHALMVFFSFKEMIIYRLNDFNYGFFIDNISEFPLIEQKTFLKYVKDTSLLFTNDQSANSLVQISQLLTHYDIEIVTDSTSIIYNSFSKGTIKQLKIVDPIIAKYIAVSLEVITDQQVIIFLLDALNKICAVTYEYAEQLINLPIDFELILNNFNVDPRPDSINFILNIIRKIFSFSTFRKGEERNKKISNFAFYVQPLLIKFIKQNLGDINIALECLLITFDAYVPLKELNNILDAITHFVSTGNRKLKIDTLYKILINNSKIQEAINQYDKKEFQTPAVITQVTDYKSFIDASYLHTSSFSLSETLQNSILRVIKNIKSQELMKRTLSNKSFQLIQESLIRIAKICHKMIIFNTIKPQYKSDEVLQREQVPSMVQLTLYDQTGKTMYLEIPSATNLSICEIFFNYMRPNNLQWRYTKLPMDAYDNAAMLLNMNEMKDIVNLESIGNDSKVALFNHFLCLESNKRFASPNMFGYYKFFYIKSQGKLFSPFDNTFHASIISNGHLELIEIPKSEQKISEKDLMNRNDIIHKENKNIVKVDAFHDSFNRAYPALNLQKRAFDYYNKLSLPLIETSLQTLKEIHRLFPNLQDKTETNDINERVFENEIFGWRMLEKMNFKSVFTPSMITASVFINFPFIFPLKLRHIFLKATALSHLQSCFTLIDDVFLKQNTSLSANQKISLIIDRDHLFEQGLTAFNLLSPGSIFFDVKFKGENGLGKGPSQEFFRLFSIEMQRNSLGIWLSDDENEKDGYAHRESDKNGGLFPSPRAVQRPDLFFTLGSLCAKAIDMEIPLPLHFSPSFFKLIRGERIELEEVSSSYAHSIEDKRGLIGLPFTLPGRDDIELRNGGKVLTTDEGNVDLYIELLRRVVTFDVFSNGNKNKEFDEKLDSSPLTPTSSSAWRALQHTNSSAIDENQQQSSLEPKHHAKTLRRAQSQSIHSEGSRLPGSISTFLSSHDPDDNNNNDGGEGEDDLNSDDDEAGGVPPEIASYIEKYSFECCASMFKEGFGRVIPWSAMDLFSNDEICFLIEGEDDLSLKSLNDDILIGGGYDSNSPQISWLFDIISNELSQNEKKLLVRFLTGSDNFGAFGLKSLIPKLSISKSERSEESLPTASTCSNSLKLPAYSSKEILKKKLLCAIYECNESFYLS